MKTRPCNLVLMQKYIIEKVINEAMRPLVLNGNKVYSYNIINFQEFKAILTIVL